MTSVVIWRQRELIDGGQLRATWDGTDTMASAEPWLQDGDLWIAADSRISSPTETGSRTVPTDAALKILPITIELYQEAEDGGPGTTPVYNAELAYAWAGDMLPATATFALASSYLKRMTGPAFTALPTIEDVAALIGRIGARYAAETGRGFEAFLVGASPRRTGTLEERAFKLGFTPTGAQHGPIAIDLSLSGSFALLGSHQDVIGPTIERAFTDDVEYVPARAIKDIIDAGTAADIGGYLNLARVRQGSVEIFPEWRNPDQGLPRPYADEQIGGLGAWRVTGIFGR